MARLLATNRRFLNTVLLEDQLSTQLAAIAQAGFDGFELWQQSFEQGDQRPLLRQWLKRGLQVIDYQVLLDFDGCCEQQRATKFHEAEQMLNVAAEMQIDMLLVAANTQACQADKIVSDLGWLCEKASKLGIRIAYEGMAWSSVINRCDLVWSTIQQVGAENLGVVIDAYHLYALQRNLSDLQGIPPEKIYLVQLSDIQRPPASEHLAKVARHARMLPGEGNLPLTELITYLDDLGYRGPIGLEVFNDQLAKQDAYAVAKRAKQALDQLLDN